VAKLLRREVDLVGLYSIGAGNRGIQAALERSDRADKIVWICHELTTYARQALLAGVADAVINQDAGHEVRSACRLALAALSGERVLPGQERIRIDIHLAGLGPAESMLLHGGTVAAGNERDGPALLGMLAVDGINSVWISALIRRADRTAVIASRVMSLAVAAISLAVGLFIVAKLRLPALEAWAAGRELVFGAVVVSAAFAAFLSAMCAARRCQPAPATRRAAAAAVSSADPAIAEAPGFR
jgi:hypothetical protein